MKRPTLLLCAAAAVLAASGCALLPAEKPRLHVVPLGPSASPPAHDADAYNQRAIALTAEGRYDEAARQLQAAILLAPERAALHNNLGYVYLLKGANAEAVRALEDALRLDPEQRRARENLETAKARIPAPASAPAAGVARIAPAPGVRLIEVAPHVYELKLPPRPIAARPLPPLPQAEPPAPLPERRFRLEVSNGNGVPGLAARVSARLRAAGVAGARLTNQPPYRQAATEIQYREGYALEAERLAALLRQEVRLVASPRLRAATDVRLVLGHDAPTETALIAGPQHVALAH